MFTNIDKALTAFIMAVISLLVSSKVIPEDLPYAEWVGLIVPALATAYSVYLIPNKK